MRVSVCGFGADLLCVFGDGDLGKALNGTKRCAEVMGEGVAEGFELAVGFFQIDGSFSNAAFEFVIEALQSGFFFAQACYNPRENCSDEAVQENSFPAKCPNRH